MTVTMAAISRDLAKAEQEFRNGNFGVAEKLLKRVLVAQPVNSRANELMAYIAGNRGDLDGVFQFLEKATRLPGASRESWYYLGVWFQRNGRYLEAVNAYQRSLEIEGPFFEALHDLGMALFSLGQTDRAVEAFDRAGAIKPGSFEVFHNRGRALQALERYDQALADYDRALALNPGHAASWFNRGETLNYVKRYDEALAAYGKALALKPDYADVHWNESLTRLVLGQLKIGWQKYEYRWKGEMAWPRRHTRIPSWLGEQPVEGKRILVWWEQGFGDTIQFCRYAPMLARSGAEVLDGGSDSCVLHLCRHSA